MNTAGAKVELTMAFIGTRSLFARAGFTKAAVLNGLPWVMWLAL